MDIEFLTENAENFKQNIQAIHQDWKGPTRVCVYFVDGYRKPLIAYGKHIIHVHGVHFELIEVDGYRFPIEKVVKVQVTF